MAEQTKTEWILSRWEGDFDVILGVYSTKPWAIEAAKKDFSDHFKDMQHSVEYHLYMATLDDEPKVLASLHHVEENK